MAKDQKRFDVLVPLANRATFEAICQMYWIGAVGVGWTGEHLNTLYKQQNDPPAWAGARGAVEGANDDSLLQWQAEMEAQWVLAQDFTAFRFDRGYGRCIWAMDGSASVENPIGQPDVQAIKTSVFGTPLPTPFDPEEEETVIVLALLEDV